MVQTNGEAARAHFESLPELTFEHFRARYDIEKQYVTKSGKGIYKSLFESKLDDAHEYKIVLKIMKLWDSGKSLTAIADHLNGQEVPTRMSKKWFHSAVNAIVKRQLHKEK